ncbi:MAG: hypothetical protein ACKVP2_18340 [Burkholderiales bacterium]
MNRIAQSVVVPEKEDLPRRDFLLHLLATGVLAGGGGWSGHARAQVAGRVPGPMKEGRSFYDVSGVVKVNGAPANLSTRVGGKDVVETGKGARAIFIVGGDAYLLRENSRIELSGASVLADSLRLMTGALLSVFGKGKKTAYLPTSTIGIRGTGLYLEVEPDRAYVCTCYGDTEIAVSDDPKISERIVSTHHDAPRYILAKPDKGRRIIPAGFKNHTDLELMLIESLVGRTPPFSLFDESYSSPRRY